MYLIDGVESATITVDGSVVWKISRLTAREQRDGRREALGCDENLIVWIDRLGRGRTVRASHEGPLMR